MELEELLEEINQRNDDYRRERAYFQHCRTRARQRGDVELKQEEYAEIERDVQNGLALSYGVFFEKNRNFDNWYRVHVGTTEFIAICDEQDLKPVTVLPEGAKRKLQTAFYAEYGRETSIRF